MKNVDIPVWEKYTLTIEEASAYFCIGEKKLRRLVTDIREAQTFYSCNVAMKKVFKAPGKCKGYYPYDTEDITCGCGNKKKRKTYSQEEREYIYKKANGCCELCGQKLKYEDMTLNHITPLSMGGADKLENLQASCLACKRFKSNILSDDFMDRIVKIFMYQIEKKCSSNIKRKMVHRLIEKLY